MSERTDSGDFEDFDDMLPEPVDASASSPSASSFQSYLDLGANHKDWPFPPRLAFDVAMQVDEPQEVLQRYDLTKDQFMEIARTREFHQAVVHFKGEIKEHGLGFRTKARIQAELMLDTAWAMVHDPLMPPSTRADLIKSMVRWGDLEPKKEADTGLQTNFQINITL